MGDTCPACGKEDAIVKAGDLHTALGDGMAAMAHLGPEAYFPLECRFCEKRFRKASAMIFATRVPSIIARILFGLR